MIRTHVVKVQNYAKYFSVLRQAIVLFRISKDKKEIDVFFL